MFDITNKIIKQIEIMKADILKSAVNKFCKNKENNNRSILCEYKQCEECKQIEKYKNNHNVHLLR